MKEYERTYKKKALSVNQTLERRRTIKALRQYEARNQPAVEDDLDFDMGSSDSDTDDDKAQQSSDESGEHSERDIQEYHNIQRNLTKKLLNMGVPGGYEKYSYEKAGEVRRQQAKTVEHYKFMLQKGVAEAMNKEELIKKFEE